MAEPHRGGNRNLVLTSRQMGVLGELPATVTDPGVVVELQSAVVAVAGVR